MVTQLRLAEDAALLLSDGTLQRPKGFVALATFYNTVNSTAPTLSVVNNELQMHELHLRSANVPMTSARWFFNPALRSYLNTLTDSVGRYFFRDELNAGTLSGFPYSMTNQLPTNLGAGSNEQYLILAATDQFILADTMSMLADSSSEATYVSGGSTVSAYQRDQTLFRVIEEIDFGCRHNRAISVGTVTGWMPSGYTGIPGAPVSTQPQDKTPSSAGSANPI
jgi:HK97 family phage major capsid protein